MPLKAHLRHAVCGGCLGPGTLPASPGSRMPESGDSCADIPQEPTALRPALLGRTTLHAALAACSAEEPRKLARQSTLQSCTSTASTTSVQGDARSVVFFSGSASSEEVGSDISEVDAEWLLTHPEVDVSNPPWHETWARIPQSAWMDRDRSELKALSVPSCKPIIVEHLPSLACVHDLHRALLSDEESNPWATFLKTGLRCRELSMSSWIGRADDPGSFAQVSKYDVPVPKDTPELIRKVLRLPEFLPSTMVSHLGYIGSTLVLNQFGRSEGVLYSDRVRIITTHTFTLHPAGGVEWKQWSETEWLIPLPWTHGFLAKVVQQRTSEEAQGHAKNFAAAWQGGPCSDEDVASMPVRTSSAADDCRRSLGKRRTICNASAR